MADKDAKGWLGKMWNDPVWSKVIAVAIVAAVGAIWATLEHKWGAVGSWITTAWTATWNWVKVGGNVPGWAQMLLYLFSGGFLFLVGVFAMAWYRKEENAIKPELKFMGLVWRWQIRRRSDRDEMVNVIAFCPECEMQIHPARFRDVPRNHTKFICDRCPGRPERLDFEGEPEEVYDLVIREAQRQLRKGILGKTEAPMPALTPQLSEELELIFENLKWRWQFRGKQLVNVRVFCPVCNHAIQPFQENQFCPTLYNCPSCCGQIKAWIGTHANLQERFTRQVLSGGY
jgi:hypothetical protein